MRIRGVRAWLWLIASALLVMMPGLTRAALPQSYGPQPATVDVLPGRLIPLLLGNKNTPSLVAAPQPRAGLVEPASATIIVTYNGFTPEAQAAFQYAVDIWSHLIISPVPIEVIANWEPLATNVLGAAGARWYLPNFPGAPRSNVYYPIALANSLAGSDLIPVSQPDHHDIDVTFNSSYPNWYFGVDGNTPRNRSDFVSVVLHELGHGFGLNGSMNVSNRQGEWGLGRNRWPDVYDLFTTNGAGESLIDITRFPNPSVALGQQPTSDNVFWNGPQGRNGAHSNPVHLYAPNPWESGSSYSHLDETTYGVGNPDSLMTPVLNQAEAVHDPGAITRGMLMDLGWQIAVLPAPEGQLSLSADWTRSDGALFSRGSMNATITSVGGQADSVRLMANGAVLVDQPFQPDAQNRMVIALNLPASTACVPTEVTGTLTGPGGTSAEFKATITIDTGVQARVNAHGTAGSVERASGGPAQVGEPLYSPTNKMYLELAPEAIECSGIKEYIKVFVSAPAGSLPSETHPFSSAIAGVQPLVTMLGGTPAPGRYDFYIDVRDNTNNVTRYPQTGGPFEIALDMAPPAIRNSTGELLPISQTTTGSNLVELDLSFLEINDDQYVVPGSNQDYWGLWLITIPSAAGVPTEQEWSRYGIVVPGRAGRALSWNTSLGLTTRYQPGTSYRVFLRALDGAGNPSTAIASQSVTVSQIDGQVLIPAVRR